MSVGFGLLRKLIDERLNITHLDKLRVPARFFVGKEKEVYTFIKDHCVSYGEAPRIETVIRETSIDLPPSSDEAIEYWADKVVERSMVTLLTKIPVEIAQNAGINKVTKALSLFKRLSRELNYRGEGIKVKTLQECAPEVLRRLDERQKSPKITGIPFGFSYLDLITDGAQAGDTIAMAGLYSRGKSYVLFKFVLSANDAGFVPLVFTAEMPVLQCTSRCISMQNSIPNTKIRHGKLSYWGREKLIRGIHRLEDEDRTPIYFMEGGMNTTVDDIALRVKELKPSALYVDGAYLIKTNNPTQKIWERVAQTGSQLKDLSLKFNIPVVSTYQLNAQRDIGHSGMSIKQLASIVMVISDVEETTGTGQLYTPIQFKELELIKGREGETLKLLMRYDFIRMTFDQHSIIGGAH